MSTKTFDDFVKKRLKEAEFSKSSNDVDWNEKREVWIQKLNDLCSKMEEYLKKINRGRSDTSHAEKHPNF